MALSSLPPKKNRPPRRLICLLKFQTKCPKIHPLNDPNLNAITLKQGKQLKSGNENISKHPHPTPNQLGSNGRELSPVYLHCSGFLFSIDETPMPAEECGYANFSANTALETSSHTSLLRGGFSRTAFHFDVCAWHVIRVIMTWIFLCRHYKVQKMGRKE